MHWVDWQSLVKVGDTVKIIGGQYAGREGTLTEISTRGSQVDYPCIVTLYEDIDMHYQVGCTANQLELKQDNKENNQ